MPAIGVFDRATSLLRYDGRAKHIQIERSYEKLPVVWGNADRLLLVFTNIIVNSFDAVSGQGNGRGTVAITSQCEGEYVVTRFEDNGPGLNEEQVARAFEPFYTTKDPGTGTGLGLWVAHRVIQQHRGTIEIQSYAGGGTVVTVKLPTRCLASRLVSVGGDGI